MAKSKPAKKTPVKKKTNTKSKSKKSGSWFKAFIWAIILILIIRTFCFQSFIVQNSTMESNLFAGDIVLINKIAYGPRIPNTPLSVPFSPFRSHYTSPKLYSTLIQLPYYRLSGYSEIKHNDIIAFNYPEEQNTPVDKKMVYTKRCVGLPGDIIQIKHTHLFVNKTEVGIANTLYKYMVTTKEKKLPASVIEKYDITEGGPVSKFGDYELFLSKEQAANLKRNKEVISIEPDTSAQFTSESLFSSSVTDNEWTVENMGPITIPNDGKTIKLTEKNITIYDSLITKYEGCKVDVINKKIFINGKETDRFTFKNNYYFVLDDNRDNAKDSRNWGFLPENHIIGKASFVFFSLNPDKTGFKKIRWKRFFKLL